MGNKLGWIVAIVLFLGLGAVVYVKIAMPSPEEPTKATTKPGRLEIIAPTTSVATVLGNEPSGPGNAADVYQKAIELFTQNRDEYKEITDRMFDGEHDHTMHDWQEQSCNKIKDIINQARNIKEMHYTFVYTPKELKVSGFADGWQEFEGLYNILEALCIHYQRQENWDKAIETAKAELLLGWHLMNERSRANLLIRGLAMQKEACYRIKKYYEAKGEKAMGEPYKTYERELDSLILTAEAKYEAIWTLRRRENKKQGAHPGDIFNILKNDKDRTWKVDAMLAMGIMKFQEKSHRGNARAMEKFFNEYANSDDEMFRAASKVAKDCTKMQVEDWMSGR